MSVFFTNLSLSEFQVRYLPFFLLFSVIDSFEWFWVGIFRKNTQLMLEPLKAPFLVLHFPYFSYCNSGAIDVKMDGSIPEEKSFFKMLGLTFSYKLDWGFYIISIAKTSSKRIGALIRSMKFLSPEVAFFLYKSTIRLCMEYRSHVLAGALSCYPELLDKVQKRICRTVGPSLATSLESLAHRRNVAS